MHCKEHDEMCPFWVVGVERAYYWMNEVPYQLHPDVKCGPWHCFCGAKTKLVRTVNPYYTNVGSFFFWCANIFLVCRQSLPCQFFQWLDQFWSAETAEWQDKDDMIYKASLSWTEEEPKENPIALAGPGRARAGPRLEPTH